MMDEKRTSRHSSRAASKQAPRLAIVALLVTLIVASFVAAPATSRADAGVADARFERGRTLMAAGRFAEARDELEASQRAEPATGTLLNLAVCNEELGQTATAREQFLAAEAASLRDGRADRVELARTHLAKLAPLLAYVMLVVPKASRPAQLELRLDDRVVAASGWNVPTPIDPGEHVVVARAPGVAERSFAVHGVAGSVQVVLIDSAAAPAATPALANAPPPADARVAAPPSPLRILAWTLGGAGVASLGAGVYFGARAFSAWDDRERRCPLDVCSDEGRRAQRTAERAAFDANLTVGIGLVALATGAGLYWLGEADAVEPGALRWAPRLGAGQVGVVTEGSW
ncbi:MAG TPA: hypothetical protein VMG12_10520 [Polyangiaceae bacterium]|nr:hypothetical protein [Polyangiaceae bacterium]